MKKKPAPARRPQDVMHRFDRLLATMAPKAQPRLEPPPPKKPKTRRAKKGRVASTSSPT